MPSQPSQHAGGEVVLSFACHGIGTFLSNPLHVVRTRVQAGVLNPKGAMSFRTLAGLRREGALLSGAAPSTAQMAVSAAIRLGAFTTVREALGGSSAHPTALPSLVAAAATGAVAGGVIAPLAAIKSQLQAVSSTTPSPAGVSASPPGRSVAWGLRQLRTALARQTRLEVATMIWRGAVLNTVQLVSLTVPTAWALAVAQAAAGDAPLTAPASLACYAGAALVSGVVVACVTTPLDLVATRAFLAHTGTGVALKAHAPVQGSGLWASVTSAAEPFRAAVANSGAAWRAVPSSLTVVVVNQFLSMLLWQGARYALLGQRQV